MPYICLLQEASTNLSSLVEKANKANYNVVATSLNCMDIPNKFNNSAMNVEQGKFTYSELILTSEQWSSKIIHIFSDTIDCDSNDPVVRRQSEEKLKQDISWTEHLQFNGYTLIRLKNKNNVNLARVITNKIKGILLVQVPLYNPKVGQSVWRRDLNENLINQIEKENSWHWWNEFRWISDFNAKLKVILELSEGERPAMDNVRRWLGEPVEGVIIPASLFIKNRHDLPVLPKLWQEVLKEFIMHGHTNFFVTTCENDKSIEAYANYLLNFREINKDMNPLLEYEDILEIPLQPLYDNLDCYTYEIFEKDPVKYKLYQDAIQAALLDRVPDELSVEALTVIMVLGAGRGPLVRSALNAAEITKRKVRIYIIEKNPNAVRTLNGIANKLWYKKDVHIFSKDMREFSPPEKADILISELLGSFADNELSPECLDCAQILLKPGGISIPCKTTSYINPIMSSKLFNAVRQAVRHEPYTREKQTIYNKHAENGYVVLLKNIYNIDKPKVLFEFSHPNTLEIIDNSRYKALQFTVSIDCVLNGFGGYFDTVLYKDIMLSINPLTHTIGMSSWFPMWFPISEPLNLKKNETIEIRFWRCVTKQKIWYEWCVVSPKITHVHNIGGRSFRIYCT